MLMNTFKVFFSSILSMNQHWFSWYCWLGDMLRY